MHPHTQMHVHLFAYSLKQRHTYTPFPHLLLDKKQTNTHTYEMGSSVVNIFISADNLELVIKDFRTRVLSWLTFSTKHDGIGPTAHLSSGTAANTHVMITGLTTLCTTNSGIDHCMF